MAHSVSSVNTFLACERKYWHNYIDHTVPCIPPSPHLEFGVMGHEVLLHAGEVRDSLEAGMTVDYEPIIPSEIVGNELKTFFNIDNWHNYFLPIIKEVANIENKCIEDIRQDSNGEEITISRELTLGGVIPNANVPSKGIIDLLIRTEHYAYILDYKFSTTVKTQADFDLNSQLAVYAILVAHEYNIPLRNIKIGYIDIPKKMFTRPEILKNGTLSRSKQANISQEIYKACVEAVHGVDDPVYNCEPGGYYYDAYCAYYFNKPAYCQMQWVDVQIVSQIVGDFYNAACAIEHKGTTKDSYLRRMDSYTCSGCEFIKDCKKYLYKEDNNLSEV